jgi:Tfp pilus assembly protein PilF
MTNRLNLHRSLLERGRTLADAGFDREAMSVLEHLSRNEAVDPNTAETAEAALADICLRHGDYQNARRHIQLALVRNPLDPNYHRTLANILDANEDTNHKRTESHYRLAAELGEDDPAFLSEYGTFLCEHGKPVRGLKMLREAARLAPEDVDILEAVVAALVDANHFEEARKLLSQARFGSTHPAEVECLREQMELQITLQRQKCRKAKSNADEPAVIPFPQSDREACSPAFGTEGDSMIIRADFPTRLPDHSRRNRRQS